MPEGPLILQYLKDLRDQLTRIEDRFDGQGARISSLEETRAKQNGVVLAFSAGLASLCGLASWLARMGGH